MSRVHGSIRKVGGRKGIGLMATWRDVAASYPEFVQWVVATFGPLPDGEVTEEDWVRYKDAYERRAGKDGEQ